MFDLITGKAIHTPHTPVVPILVSTAAHVVVVVSFRLEDVK